MTTTPSIPLDDTTLTLIEEALNTSLTVNDAGDHELVGGTFTLHGLLDFFSGYDPTLVTHLDGDVYQYDGGPILHPNDLIRALIAEVRALRTR